MTTEDLRDRPIFICGHPKAGTSLLRAVFDSHPQLVVYPEETVFFRRFLPRAGNRAGETLFQVADESLIHIFLWNRDNPPASQAGFPDRDYSSIPYEQVRSEMRRLLGERCNHPGDILSAAVLAYGQVCKQITPTTRAWVEKSPYNEFFTEKIYGWWPQARCVHIVRDPRDNYVSYRRKHPDWSAEIFAASWQRSTRAGLYNLAHYGADKYLILRFEDLAGSPENSLRQLTTFLGIAWDESLAAPTRAGASWQGNSMFSESFEAISAAPVARWREQLAISDVALIERICSGLMGRFRYSSSDAGLSERIIAAGRAASWPLRRHIRRTHPSAGNQADNDE